jgi:hypothetical protein
LAKNENLEKYSNKNKIKILFSPPITSPTCQKNKTTVNATILLQANINTTLIIHPE